eukprot:102802_1
MSTRAPRRSLFGDPENLSDIQRLELQEYVQTTWNGASVGGAFGALPFAVCYYRYRFPHKSHQWLAFSKLKHVLGFGVVSVAIGTYMGTLTGMVIKYYRVKQFFRDSEHK